MSTTQGVQSMLRGTLRYAGYSKIMYGLVTLGLLDDAPVPALSPAAEKISWLATLALRLGCEATRGAVEDAVVARLAKVDQAYAEKCLEAMGWLGLLDASNEAPRRGTFLDALCETMLGKMSYGPREVDLVLMTHTLDVEFPGGRFEHRTCSLAEYLQQDACLSTTRRRRRRR